MTFRLRPYQATLLQRVQDALAAEPRTRLMLQLPTGGAVILMAQTVGRTGDHTEAGIEQANRDRPGIMTAGALDFW